MKRNKWQRLAAIGLCSSLLVNAFSGVTAVAETVTIESSPTAESSTKEETPASSVKEETTKTSTQNSQVTTDTSQEEETKEAEKQAETEVSTETPEVKTNTTEQAPANSSESDLQKSISPRWVPNNQVIYPRMTFAFTDETGKAFANENLTLSGTYYKLANRTATSQWSPYADRYPIVSSNAGGGQYRVAVNAAVPMPYDFLTNLPVGYHMNIYAIEQLKIDNTLKYVDSIVASSSSINMTRYSVQQTSEAAQFGNYAKYGLSQRDKTFSKNSASIFSLNSVAFATTIGGVLTIMRTDSVEKDILLMGFDGTATYRETLNYVVTRKQVTEKFVNTSGVAITPPTGFTQNKKTPMTSNAFTFKQAGTLPDTYKVGTKTYKFKGWYKGKTKPSALTTTKAPSYAVTYDDNDDLNVVYEELIPKDTWVYPGFHAEFVDEKGQAFNEPLTFSGNYTQTLRKAVDQTYVTTGAMNPLVSIKNTNKANVYTITTQSRVNIPANFDEVPSDIYDMRTYAINDWNITTELKYIDKIETMNTTLPVSEYPVGFVGTDPVFNNSGPGQLNEIDKSFKKGVDNKFSIKATFGVGSSVNTVPRLLLVARATGNPENKIVLHGFDGTQDFKQTMNYKVTRKQVTENFVDANGAKITAPTGFTQGNQVPMNSNTFKYTAAQALPTTYTAGGKTYTFQGWYKGKTKPSTLNKTTTPTFNATFDGNDDMTAMYKEEIPTASVTLTRPKEVIDTNTNVIWTTTITNTSKAPLQNLTLKKGPNWSAGLTIPTFMEVTPEGETTKSIPVNSTLWTEGVSLPNAVPIGKKVSIAFTTRATGKPNTVLKAEVVVFGG
ncbi:WxL domain-containing protein, partial [Enterococcus faecalis]